MDRVADAEAEEDARALEMDAMREPEREAERDADPEPEAALLADPAAKSSMSARRKGEDT